MASVVLRRALDRPLTRLSERFMGVSFLAGLKACGKKHQNRYKIRPSPPGVNSNQVFVHWLSQGGLASSPGVRAPEESPPGCKGRDLLYPCVCVCVADCMFHNCYSGSERMQMHAPLMGRNNNTRGHHRGWQRKNIYTRNV